MPTYYIINKNNKGEGVTVIANNRTLALEKIVNYLGWAIQPRKRRKIVNRKNGVATPLMV